MDAAVEEAKALLEQAGYRVIKEDRIARLTHSHYISGLYLYQEGAEKLREHYFHQACREFGMELGLRKYIAWDQYPRTGDGERYRGEVHVIKPRMDA